MNPVLQQKIFDPEMEYIKQWVPEAGTKAYPESMLDLKQVKMSAIATHKESVPYLKYV